MCLWLKASLAVLGLEIKSGSLKWHNEKSKKGADGGECHYMRPSGKAYTEAIQLLFMNLKCIFLREDHI